WLFGILSAALTLLRVSADRRRLKRELRVTEAEAANLRSLPLPDADCSHFRPCRDPDRLRRARVGIRPREPGTRQRAAARDQRGLFPRPEPRAEPQDRRGARAFHPAREGRRRDARDPLRARALVPPARRGRSGDTR